MGGGEGIEVGGCRILLDGLLGAIFRTCARTHQVLVDLAQLVVGVVIITCAEL